MKIRAEHLEEMREAIAPLLKANPDQADKYRAAGLSEMRFRWDVLHASKYDVCKLYSYLNDSHIDTALRNIVQK